MTARLITVRQHWGLALVVALVLIAALPVLTYPFWSDHGIYGNIGRTILAGGTPLVDMWDQKPPAIYYLYAGALALFGNSMTGARALDFALMPLAMLGVYGMGTLLSDRKVGFFSALIFGVFYFSEPFATLTQSDSLVLAPISLALFATLYATQQPRASQAAVIGAFVAGFISGVIVWFKPHYLLMLISWVAFVMIARRSFPLREALAFIGGGLITGGGLLLIFLSNGVFAEILIIADGSSGYATQWGAFLRDLPNYLTFRWWQWGVMVILAALWWLFDARQALRSGRGWGLIVLSAVGALGFVIIQTKGFDTHWLPLLPSLALFAGAFVAKRARSTGLSGLVTVALLAILINTTWGSSFAYWTGQESQRDYYARFTGGTMNAGASLDVANWLTERVAAGDTLYIWGMRPEVIFMANLRPATRFQHSPPLVDPNFPDAWRDENVAVLWAAMPPYAIVMQNDFMPWVTGNNLDSHQTLVEYTELSNWYSANYTRVEQIGNFIIWQRQSSPSG